MKKLHGQFQDPFTKKETNFVEFIPAGKFISKVRTILKLGNLKIKENNQSFEISNILSKKRHINFLAKYIKKKHNDVIIVYKFGNEKTKYKSRTNYVRNFEYKAELFSNMTAKPETPENLIRYAMVNLMNHYYEYMVDVVEGSDILPFHSVIFKFI